MLEAENESHVNRLSREISALRAMQLSNNNQTHGQGPSGAAGPSTSGNGVGNGVSFAMPPQGVMLEAMTRENEALRSRL